MKEIYVNYAKYNLWAHIRLADFFKSIKETEAEQHIEGSFPSLKKTVLHIWDAEVVWLKRLRNEKINEFPSRNFTGTFQEALQGWVANSRSFLAHVESMSEGDFSVEHSFQTISSGNYIHKAAEMIHHCLNHSTYHRGQLITMARQLDLTNPPSTDMIFYLREKQ